MKGAKLDFEAFVASILTATALPVASQFARQLWSGAGGLDPVAFAAATFVYFFGATIATAAIATPALLLAWRFGRISLPVCAAIGAVCGGVPLALLNSHVEDVRDIISVVAEYAAYGAVSGSVYYLFLTPAATSAATGTATPPSARPPA
jgi:hypothetical protein